MNVFLKYILKSSLSKKGRSLLLILTITISASLLIGAIGAVEASNMASEEYAKRTFGDYDVIITANKTNDAPFFNKKILSKSDFESYIDTANAFGYLLSDSNVDVEIDGVGWKSYDKLPNMKILNSDRLDSGSNSKIIISEKTRRIFNYKLGDMIRLKINGNNINFRISGIAEPKGVFSTDSNSHFSVVADKNNVCSILGREDATSSILAKLKQGIDTKSYITNFNKMYSDCVADMTFDKQKAESDNETIVDLLYFMLFIVVIMSSFIIFSCFKLIVLERMPVIGTFLSQGETVGGVMRLLLYESLFYGTISGIFSIFIGKGLLYLLADVTNAYREYGVETVVNYNVSYFVVGFIFAIAISVLSSLIPVLNIKRLQVKDVILNKINVSFKGSAKLSVFGAVLAIIAIAASLLDESISVSFSPILFFMFFIGAVMSMPGIITAVSYPLARLLENLNITFKLALTNIRTSKVLLNNMRLIVIGVISISIIMSLSYSYMNALLGATSGYNYDVEVFQGTDPVKIKATIYRNKNIKKVIETYFVPSGEIKDTDMKIAIGGIIPDTYRILNNYFGIDNPSEFYAELNKSERNMAISERAAKTINKVKGDYLVLRVNNREARYKITGIFNSKFSPNQILINKDNIIRDFRVKVPDSYGLQVTGNADEVKKILQKELKGTSAKVKTFAEEMNDAKEGIVQLINVLMFFSIMTVIMGIFGIISNVGVSFIQRKKDFALLNSVGLSNGGVKIMILLEGVFTALFSLVFGGITSYLSVIILNNLAKLIELSIPIEYDFSSFISIGVGIFIVMIITNLFGVFKSSKISVIEELKYE
jgi:putative ABC transport system permease protein